MEFSHVPVMLGECINALEIKEDGIYVDCTAGGGGHSLAILQKLKNGKLVSVDRDEDAITICRQRFAEYSDRSILVRDNFVNIDSILSKLGIGKIDGLLIDLGVSSHQLDTAERGFSYHSETRLDMRMDASSSVSAYEIVNEYSELDLRRIISDYGEENFASKIAWRIVTEREAGNIETTLQLSELIRKAIPQKSREKENQHPARRTFQAIRIEVNGELEVIAPTIRSAVSCLNKDGKIAIITFHSLEDRIVKQTLTSLSEGCTCPRNFPVCVCGNKPTVAQASKKQIPPSDEELLINPRSRSAKLRVAKKL